MKYRRSLQLTGCVLAALLSVAAISVDTLKKDVVWLTDSARDGRKSRTPGAAAAANYVAGRFKEIGFDVQLQEIGGDRRNVVAKTGNYEKYILIGSHYDGQGSGFPSASDNAAGVAALVELGRELKAEELPVSLVLVAFDDEEQGLNGSRYYADHPLYPLDGALAAIIFDTMGRSFIDLQSWTLFVLGTEYSRELAQAVDKKANAEMLVVGTDLIGPRSDFAPFAVKHVPYLFFSHGTHKDYHGPGDTAEKINYPRLSKDIGLISEIITDIARLGKRPTYLDVPVYPEGEKTTLLSHLSALESERNDLPAAYRLMFEDMRVRIGTDDSRDSLRMATAGLLAIATPRFSPFMLTLILGPYYERENKPAIAAAIYEEALNWVLNTSERGDLEEKIRSLRGQP